MKHLPPGTLVTSDALDKMTYLRACIKEGFRYQLRWTTVSVKEWLLIKYRNLGNIAFILFMLAIKEINHRIQLSPSHILFFTLPYALDTSYFDRQTTFIGQNGR